MVDLDLQASREQRPRSVTCKTKAGLGAEHTCVTSTKSLARRKTSLYLLRKSVSMRACTIKEVSHSLRKRNRRKEEKKVWRQTAKQRRHCCALGGIIQLSGCDFFEKWYAHLAAVRAVHFHAIAAHPQIVRQTLDMLCKACTAWPFAHPVARAVVKKGGN